MNERIKEILVETGYLIPGETGYLISGDKFIDSDFCHKFAELIVQECVTQLRKEGERAKIQAFTGSTYKFTYMNEAANVIKRHFGVEE